MFVNFDLVVCTIAMRFNFFFMKAKQARLGNIKSWSPDMEENALDKPWLGVSFEHPVFITAILTQGDENDDAFVEKYSVEISRDYGTTWMPVLDDDGNALKIFEANSDGHTAAQIEFDERLDDVTDLRIMPVEWNIRPALRIELKGCYSVVVSTTEKVTTKEVVISTTKIGETSTPYVGTSSTVPIVVTTKKVFPTTTQTIVVSSPLVSSTILPEESTTEQPKTETASTKVKI